MISLATITPEQMKEKMEYLREARKRKGRNQFILGGYVNTIYKSSGDGKRYVRSRKNFKILTEKILKECHERLDENLREILERK